MEAARDARSSTIDLSKDIQGDNQWFNSLLLTREVENIVDTPFIHKVLTSKQNQKKIDLFQLKWIGGF